MTSPPGALNKIESNGIGPVSKQHNGYVTRKLLGGSHGLVVVGGDSHSIGCGFESQYRILDGQKN